MTNQLTDKEIDDMLEVLSESQNDFESPWFVSRIGLRQFASAVISAHDAKQDKQASDATLKATFERLENEVRLVQRIIDLEAEVTKLKEQLAEKQSAINLKINVDTSEVTAALAKINALSEAFYKVEKGGDYYVSIHERQDDGTTIIKENTKFKDQLDDGWIEWRGGDCPVNPESIVECKSSTHRFTGPARHYRWKHSIKDTDIIAYRVIKK